MVQRIASLFFGLGLYGLGIVMTIRSGLGTSPWDAFHLGVTNYLPLTVGQVAQGTGLVVIVLSLFLGIKPGWGTLANMYFIGVFIDIFMAAAWITTPQSWLLKLAMLLGGVGVIGWASYFYLIAGLGAGPRDSFMVGAVQRSGWPVWKIRTAIETTMACLGYALGGPVGLGTLITAFTLGPAIQLSFSLMGKRAQDIKHDGLWLRSRPETAKPLPGEE